MTKAVTLETLAATLDTVAQDQAALGEVVSESLKTKSINPFLGTKLGRITEKKHVAGSPESDHLLNSFFSKSIDVGGKSMSGMPLFCHAVKLAGYNNVIGPLDMYSKAATGMGIQVGEDGGYLVPPDQRSEILTRAFLDNDLLSRTRRLTTASNTVKIPGLNDASRANGSRYGGVAGYWMDEGVTPTASKPQFRMIELNLHKLGVLAVATEELVQDAGGTLDQVLNYAVGGELAFKIGDSIINGAGAGMPIGILNSNATVQASKETNQPVDTITYANIRQMWMRLHPAARAGAIWLYNPDCEAELNSLTQNIGTGGVPVYLPPGGLSSTPYGSLLGRPIVPCEFCGTLGDRGDIILCNLSGYITIAKTTGIEQSVSMHARFDSGQDTYRWMVRIDGQPEHEAPITPYKGNLQTSYFVVLEAR